MPHHEIIKEIIIYIVAYLLFISYIGNINFVNSSLIKLHAIVIYVAR